MEPLERQQYQELFGAGSISLSSWTQISALGLEAMRQASKRWLYDYKPYAGENPTQEQYVEELRLNFFQPDRFYSVLELLAELQQPQLTRNYVDQLPVAEALRAEIAIGGTVDKVLEWVNFARLNLPVADFQYVIIAGLKSAVCHDRIEIFAALLPWSEFKFRPTMVASLEKKPAYASLFLRACWQQQPARLAAYVEALASSCHLDRHFFLELLQYVGLENIDGRQFVLKAQSPTELVQVLEFLDRHQTQESTLQHLVDLTAKWVTWQSFYMQPLYASLIETVWQYLCRSSDCQPRRQATNHIGRLAMKYNLVAIAADIQAQYPELSLEGLRYPDHDGRYALNTATASAARAAVKLRQQAEPLLRRVVAMVVRPEEVAPTMQELLELELTGPAWRLNALYWLAQLNFYGSSYLRRDSKWVFKIGICLETNPIADLSSAPSVSEFLAAARRLLVDAYAHPIAYGMGYEFQGFHQIQMVLPHCLSRLCYYQLPLSKLMLSQDALKHDRLKLLNMAVLYGRNEVALEILQLDANPQRQDRLETQWVELEPLRRQDL